MDGDLQELVPDFRPLLSFKLEEHDAGRNDVLAPVSTTLRALAHDPSILSRAMADYLCVLRITNDRKRIEEECNALAAKHSSVLSALHAVNSLPPTTHTADRLHSTNCGTSDSMPVELLALVFAVSTTLVFVDPERPERLYEPFNMKMRLVCRRWRDVIDSTPVLWARLDLNSESIDTKKLRIALARSKNVPLELIIYVSTLDEQLHSVLHPHIDRTRSLTLFRVPRRVGGFGKTLRLSQITVAIHESLARRGMYYLERLMQGSASSLEAIRIEGLSDVPEGDIWEIEPPRLRYACIRDTQFATHPVGLFDSSAMTTLIFDQSVVWETADEVLRILAFLHNLQHLEWSNKGLWSGHRLTFDHPANFAHKSVDLPRLDYLELCIQPEIIAFLIPVLNFPLSTKLVIGGLFESEPNVNSPFFDTLLDNLRLAFMPHLQSLFPDETSGYRSLNISIFTRHEDESGFSLVASRASSPATTSAPDFDFGVVWDTESQDVYMEVLMQALSWPGMARTVTALYVGADFLEDKRRWARLLRALPALTSVRTHGRGARALLRVLRADAAAASDVLPALDAIALDLDKPPHKTIALLVETLDARVRAGRKKLSLSLQGDLDSSTMAPLEGHQGMKEIQWKDPMANFKRQLAEWASKRDSSKDDEYGGVMFSAGDVGPEEDEEGDAETSEDDSMSGVEE